MARSHRSKSTGSYKDVGLGEDSAGNASSSVETTNLKNNESSLASKTAKMVELLKAFQSLSDATGRPLLHNNTNLTLAGALLVRLRQLMHHHQELTLFLQKKRKGNQQLESLQTDWLLARDEESGYTALHWAIFQKDLAKVLLLLRDGLSDQNDLLDLFSVAPPRLSQRPMLVLAGDVHAAITPLMNEMVSAVDNEGLTPGQLLALLQRKELQECRRTAVYRPRVGIHSSYRDSRRNSFDVEDTVGDEQDEFDELNRYVHQLNRSQQQESFNVSDDPPKNETMYGCELFTFGRAHHCALGVGQESSDGERKLRPQRVQEFGGRMGRAVAVAGAAHHTLAVTAKGHLYAFGLGKGGRLGTGNDSHCPRPRRVRGPLSNRHVVGVAAAENHSLCVTKCGEVFSFGSNRFGQLGTAEEGSRCLPRRVEGLKGIRCVAVAAGAKHSVALSVKGEVYVWGFNASGQLGIIRRNGIQKVQRVESLWGNSKVAVQISASDQSTMVLVSATASSLPVNSIYVFGHGSHTPTRVHFGSDPFETASNNFFAGKRTHRHHNRPINPVAIASARHHNVAVTGDGLVYTWGLHSEALGNGSNERRNKPSVGKMIASPQLVTGMLPENGGGFAVGVSASENHTAVITDTGALYTWGATSPQNVLGHPGVRWQPNPKRVPGVCRAVGVSAAREHTCILIGASYPPIPQIREDGVGSVASLEELATREIMKHVDLFSVLPILLTAQRTESVGLQDYCLDFARRNMDGVLKVAQKSVLDAYLNEQLLGNDLRTDAEVIADHLDASIHPLFYSAIVGTGSNDTSTCGRQALSSFHEWIEESSAICDTKPAKLLLNRVVNASRGTTDSYKARLRKARSMSESNNRHDKESICSERCVELITNMELGSLDVAERKQAALIRELRSTRKKLAQIQKLEDSASSQSGEVELSNEQQEKVGRRPQLEADLQLFEPALQTVERRIRQLKQLRLFQESAVSSIEKVGPTTEPVIESKCFETKAIEESTTSVDPKSYRCTVCEINCPDQRSYELHMNGRKHRNRVAQVENEEKKKATAEIAKEKLSQQLKTDGFSPRTAKSSPQAKGWKDITPPPKFKLPGPPHPVPEAVVSLAATNLQTPTKSTRSTSRVSLMDIMHEEQKRKPVNPTIQNPKTLQWGSPMTKAPARSGASSPWDRQQKQKDKSHSLADFLTPTKLTPSKCPLGSSSWGAARPASKTSPVVAAQRRPSPTASPGMSLVDIQKQEQDLKEKAAEQATYGATGPSGWYVERRERAGSFQELQRREQQVIEERLFIEEQIRIEQMILKEQEEAEAAAAKAKKKKKPAPNNNNKNKNKKKNFRNKKKSPEGSQQAQTKTSGGGATKGAPKKSGPNQKGAKGGQKQSTKSQPVAAGKLPPAAS